MATPKADYILPWIRQTESGCWQWQRCFGPGGYGRVKVAGRLCMAHRISHEAFNGPIPPGYQVDHLCKNPSCVNPAHLEAVTPAENNRRSDSWSAIKARTTHCPRGHAYDTANTYVNPRGSRLCRTCNRERAARLKAAARAGRHLEGA